MFTLCKQSSGSTLRLPSVEAAQQEVQTGNENIQMKKTPELEVHEEQTEAEQAQNTSQHGQKGTQRQKH